MNHKREWASVLNDLKSVTLYGGAAGQKRAILAADQIVRAAIKELKECRKSFGPCANCKHRSALCRAVENFEREGEG